MRATLGLTAAAILVLNSEAFAQRNFSSSQRAGLQAYVTQLQAQQRAQQQTQMRQINQQFDKQQTEFLMERNRVNRLAEGMEDLNADPAGRSYRRSRGSNSFGDMHYANSLFMRTSPYYDYRFITARNRVITNLSNGPSIPR